MSFMVEPTMAAKRSRANTVIYRLTATPKWTSGRRPAEAVEEAARPLSGGAGAWMSASRRRLREELADGARRARRR